MVRVLPVTVTVGQAGDSLPLIRWGVLTAEGRPTVEDIRLGEDGVVAIQHDDGYVRDWVTEDTYWETVESLANSAGEWLVLDTALDSENVGRIVREQELWNDCFGVEGQDG